MEDLEELQLYQLKNNLQKSNAQIVSLKSLKLTLKQCLLKTTKEVQPTQEEIASDGKEALRKKLLIKTMKTNSNLRIILNHFKDSASKE